MIVGKIQTGEIDRTAVLRLGYASSKQYRKSKIRCVSDRSQESHRLRPWGRHRSTPLYFYI